jgi:hypothetical protein
MRQIQIRKPVRKTTRGTTRPDRYDIDLRTPSGRLLRY